MGYPTREEQRERSKLAKWERQNREGIIGRKNLFGAADLIARNASGRMVKKKFNIKYK